LLGQLRQQCFHHFPERIPPAQRIEPQAAGFIRLGTEPAVVIRLRAAITPSSPIRRIWLAVADSDANDAPPGWLTELAGPQDAVYVCEPRGIGASRWSRKNPPNFVERAHYLLGRTVDSGRVWDLAAAARYLRALHGEPSQVYLAGEGAAAILAVHAALLEPDVAGILLSRPPATHMADGAPTLLKVLRVCDVPEAVGLLAPRPVTVLGQTQGWSNRTAAIYRAAGAPDKFIVRR
jgi:hypothetical protein